MANGSPEGVSAHHSNPLERVHEDVMQALTYGMHHNGELPSDVVARLPFNKTAMVIGACAVLGYAPAVARYGSSMRQRQAVGLLGERSGISKKDQIHLPNDQQVIVSLEEARSEGGQPDIATLLVLARKIEQPRPKRNWLVRTAGKVASDFASGARSIYEPRNDPLNYALNQLIVDTHGQGSRQNKRRPTEAPIVYAKIIEVLGRSKYPTPDLVAAAVERFEGSWKASLNHHAAYPKVIHELHRQIQMSELSGKSASKRLVALAAEHAGMIALRDTTEAKAVTARQAAKQARTSRKELRKRHEYEAAQAYGECVGQTPGELASRTYRLLKAIAVAPEGSGKSQQQAALISNIMALSERAAAGDSMSRQAFEHCWPLATFNMTANLTQRIQDIKQGVGRPEDILAIERLAVGKMRDASLPRNIRALHVAARSGAFEHYAVATVVTGKGSGGGKPQYHMNLYSHEVADVIVVCYANDLLSKGASVQREFLGVTNARMARLDEVEKRADRSVLDTFLILRPQLEALDDWKRQTRRTRLTERSQAAWEAVSGKGKLRR